MSDPRGFLKLHVLLSAFFLASCTSNAGQAPLSSEVQTLLPDAYQKPIDPSVQACDNFYAHACGSWLKDVEIPAGKEYVMWKDQKAEAENERALREILEGTESSNPETERLRTFFTSCMSAPANGSGADQKIFDSWSQKILAVKTRSAFWSVWQDLQKAGVNAFLSYSGELNWSDWKNFQGQIHQGRLGLQPHTVYADTTDAGKKALAAYQSRMEELLLPFKGNQKNRSAAASILRIESALAAASIPRNDLFRSERSNHPMKPSELETLAPAIPWTQYFNLVENPSQRLVKVTAPAYIKALQQVLAQESVEDLRDFLLWQWLDQLQPYRPASLASDPSLRRSQCRTATILALGVELSRQFAEKYIGAAAREQGKDIAVSIQKTIADSVRDIDWLSPEARELTSEKIGLTDFKVGFPNEWPAVGAFALDRDSFLKNILAAQSYEQQRSWTRAQKSRSRSSWEMKVYPIGAHGMAAARLMIDNGFPDVFSNSIILTAASLQKPRLDPAAPPVLIYGGFGSFVGHELVHVLEFPQIDKTGAPAQLWTDAEYDAYQSRRADCLTKQASEFTINGKPAVDATKTLSENVADLSGVRYSYRAMTRSLPQLEDPADRKAQARRFFYAYAQHWCTKVLPDKPFSPNHATPEFRVNGPLSNLPEFAEAFSCREGSNMLRPAAARCSVW